MKATLNILLTIFLGLSLSFCSSSPKEDEAQPEANSDGYSSSETYDDINSAAGDGDDLGSSADYSGDDTYAGADSDSGGDDLFLGGGEDDSTPAPANDPLPVERIEESPSAPVMDTPSSDFKDGFYVISSNCNMRAEPDSSSASEGKVKAGKRLWVEGFDNQWVKVFKRSGQVFLSRSCL